MHKLIRLSHDIFYFVLFLFLAAIFGVLAIALSYTAPLFGNAIIQVPTTVYGAVGGPLFALFFLGFFVPFAEKWVRRTSLKQAML